MEEGIENVSGFEYKIVFIDRQADGGNESRVGKGKIDRWLVTPGRRERPGLELWI